MLMLRTRLKEAVPIENQKKKKRGVNLKRYI